jgi:hypothetical protein
VQVALAPVRIGKLDLINAIAQVELAQRHGQPALAGAVLDLHAVGEAALGELHVGVVDEHVRQHDLFEHADPGKQHRL